MSRAPRSSPEMFVVQSNGRSARLPILGHDIPSDLSDDDIAGIGEGEGDDDELDDEELDESLDESDRTEPFNTTGLKEISNLASWTVSTAKSGSGVQALRDDDTNLFWQSDGPQPHILNIHFVKMVNITIIRIHLDFSLDESYTPTRILFLAGTSYHDLIEFSELAFDQPKGWVDVDLTGVGGGPDKNTLRAFIVQMKILENHQNGKDTHVRGVKIYAQEETVRVDDLRMDISPAAEDSPAPPVTAKARAKARARAAARASLEAQYPAEPSWSLNPVLR